MKLPNTLITAKQAALAASKFPGDWKAQKYHWKRIKAYGELERRALQKLGAEIKLVTK
jgi:hypothetical protein